MRFRQGLSRQEIRQRLEYFSRNIFGSASTKDFQDKILQRVFDGKNVLGISATGSGKSFCFWLPALLKPGLTLVIAPLRIKKFLPELDRLQEFIPLNFLAVDEAHCISEWGHDFRPSYLKLPFLRETKETRETEHQQVIDRQLTDFLNKQNALVQNLSQPIDSFSRVSKAQSADLAATNEKLDELATAFNGHRTGAQNELAVLAAGIAELKTLLTEVQDGLRSQGESIAAVDSSLQDATTRLNQTIEKLKQLPLVGGKFR